MEAKLAAHIALWCLILPECFARSTNNCSYCGQQTIEQHMNPLRKLAMHSTFQTPKLYCCTTWELLRTWSWFCMDSSMVLTPSWAKEWCTHRRAKCRRILHSRIVDHWNTKRLRKYSNYVLVCNNLREFRIIQHVIVKMLQREGGLCSDIFGNCVASINKHGIIRNIFYRNRYSAVQTNGF